MLTAKEIRHISNKFDYGTLAHKMAEEIVEEARLIATRTGDCKLAYSFPPDATSPYITAKTREILEKLGFEVSISLAFDNRITVRW